MERLNLSLYRHDQQSFLQPQLFRFLNLRVQASLLVRAKVEFAQLLAMLEQQVLALRPLD
jgi:hypothetical protein